MHIVHVLNGLSVTASAIDQIQYTLQDSQHQVTLIVGPPEHKSIAETLPESLDLITQKNNLFSVAGFIELLHTVKTINPDVLHVHHAKSGFISMLVSKIKGVPIVVEDGAKRNNYTFPTRVLFTLMEWQATKVVFVSKAVENSLSCLERRLINKTKTQVIYYGLQLPDVKEEAESRFRTKYQLREEDIVIAHTGRFVPVKNQMGIIELFSKLSSNTNMKLVIAGDGPLRQKLSSRVTDLNLDNKVIFCGMLEREEVYSLLSIAKYFMMLSHTEGHSVSLLEAMGFGCVPILSSIDSFLETVDAGHAIFLSSDCDDVFDLQQRMNLIKPENIKQYYHQRYSEKKMMSAYYDLYESSRRDYG